MNLHIRDNLNFLHDFAVPVLTRKTADESVTSSTTLQDDNDLFFDVGPNQTWEVTCVLAADGASAGDLSWAFTVPSGASMFGRMVRLAGGAATQSETAASWDSDWTTALVHGLLGAGAICPLTLHGLYIGGSAGGRVQLQWAQDVSSGTATTVGTGSFLIARRLI